MKVVSNIITSRNGKKVNRGDVVELDMLTAVRWINEGYASAYVEPKKRDVKKVTKSVKRVDKPSKEGD